MAPKALWRLDGKKVVDLRNERTMTRAALKRASGLDLETLEAIETGKRRDGEPTELWGCDLWTFREGKIAIRNTFWKISPATRPRSPDATQDHS